MQKSTSNRSIPKQPKKSEMLWTVVLVDCGVPILAEAYRDEKIARLRERTLRKGINPDYDEVGVFEVEIGKRGDED